MIVMFEKNSEYRENELPDNSVYIVVKPAAGGRLNGPAISSPVGRLRRPNKQLNRQLLHERVRSAIPVNRGPVRMPTNIIILQMKTWGNWEAISRPVWFGCWDDNGSQL